MPRKHRRSRKGGSIFYEQPTGLAAVEQTVENTVTNIGTTASNTVSGMKKSFSDWWNGNNQSSSYLPTTTYGGRKRTSRRKHKGGFKANTPSSGLAAHASSYSGSPTAKPHNLVGGRTRRRRQSKRRR
jgi:hypothetical protein